MIVESIQIWELLMPFHPDVLPSYVPDQQSLRPFLCTTATEPYVVSFPWNDKENGNIRGVRINLVTKV